MASDSRSKRIPGALRIRCKNDWRGTARSSSLAAFGLSACPPVAGRSPWAPARRSLRQRGATGGGFPARRPYGPDAGECCRPKHRVSRMCVAARTAEPYRMPTPTLKRRLQRLEAIGQREAELAPDRCRFITRAAVQHLSTDELRSALGAHEALREGREPTSQELAAANALKTATEVECRRAGMAPAKFNRRSRRAG